MVWVGWGVVWCGVVWCGVVWCGVVWCGVVWCGVVWCGVVWCGVVWCGVVWCGVVWCGVVWCAEGAVTIWQWRGCLAYGNSKTGRVCACACFVLRAACVYAPSWRPVLLPHVAGLVQGRSGDPLPLRLLVQLQFPQGPCHGAPGSCSRLNEALSCLGVREPRIGTPSPPVS